MKNLRPLTEFGNLKECDEELKSIFHELFPDPSEIKVFWTFLDKCKGFECICPDFFERIPKTVSQFKSMGLTIKHCYMISVIGHEHGGIHIDYKTNNVRINWPVHNENSVLTKWYSFSGNLMECPIKAVDGTGPHYQEIPEDQCTVIEQHIFNGPTAFRVDIPHSVEAISGAPLPRVAFSFTFEEQDRVNLLL